MKILEFFCLFVSLHGAASGILVPQPGIEPVPRAVEVRSLNHWTAREVQNEDIGMRKCKDLPALGFRM